MYARCSAAETGRTSSDVVTPSSLGQTTPRRADAVDDVPLQGTGHLTGVLGRGEVAGVLGVGQRPGEVVVGVLEPPPEVSPHRPDRVVPVGPVDPREQRLE